MDEDDEKTVRYWNKLGLKPKKVDPAIFEGYNKAIVLGAAATLDDIEKWFFNSDLSNVFIAAADGGTRWLLDHNLTPDLVVTDLDGITISDIRFLIKEKVPMQILAHGDNKNKIQNMLDAIDINHYPSISFSTQGKPILNWDNTLGFTDGDRAACLLREYIKNIYLLGFDLNADFIGKYSKPHFAENQPMVPAKKVKLEIAWDILTWLDHHHRIYSPNYKLSPGIELNFDDFLNL